MLSDCEFHVAVCIVGTEFILCSWMFTLKWDEIVKKFAVLCSTVLTVWCSSRGTFVAKIRQVFCVQSRVAISLGALR